MNDDDDDRPLPDRPATLHDLIRMMTPVLIATNHLGIAVMAAGRDDKQALFKAMDDALAALGAARAEFLRLTGSLGDE